MADNKPLKYLPRIAEYYQVLGYGEPYRWAHFDEVPFTVLSKPVSQSTIGIVTTASVYDPDKGDQEAGAPYNGRAKFFTVYARPTNIEPDLRISHIAYDRDHSDASDQGCYFPLKAFKQLKADGIFANLSPRFYGLPTNRSQKTTINVDCVELVRLCQQDSIDAAVLVPNCPVCHQSVSLAARALESSGIATVIMGCALDVVEHVGVPRFLFSNFPLGNSAGLPGNFESQLAIARLSLELLDTALKSRTTIQSPFVWNGDTDWKSNYSNAKLLSCDEIDKRRGEFDKGKQDARLSRDSKSVEYEIIEAKSEGCDH